MSAGGGRIISACSRDYKVGGCRKASLQCAKLRGGCGKRRSAEAAEIAGGGAWALAAVRAHVVGRLEAASV